MTIPQIILALISAYFFIERQRQYFSHSYAQSFLKYFSTTIIWGICFTIAIFPSLAHTLSVTLGFGNNYNTLIFTAFVIVFVILSKILNLIERIEKNITTLTQEIALTKKFKPPKIK